MELRKVVRVVTVAIALCAATSSGSLIFITSYLHRLTSQIDANLQSVRAAEEIELQLLWHARNTHQANLTSAPELAAEAAQAQVEVLRWLDAARMYVGSAEEAAILAGLEHELDVYFTEQEELARAGLSALDRYLEADAPFDGAYAQAEELLRVNLTQATLAMEQAAHWDTIATAIGLSVAIAIVVLTALLIVGARNAVYRPLLALGDAMRRYGARDYTARVEQQGPLEIRGIARAFNEMAEELERQRAQQLTFVASVAHDLRNPLGAMRAAVEAIAASGTSHRELTLLITRQIDVLVRLISDLLDAARIEAGQFALTPEDCDARGFVADAVALFREVAPLHELVTRLPARPLPIRCDRARVSQVVNNLLSNAIKYAPQGGRIVAGAAAQANGVLIEITDNGVGIPAEECAAIFEPFRRVSTPGLAIQGVGIGLSVARRIVESHGGRISVASIVGAGSTFSVWLPATQDAGSSR